MPGHAGGDSPRLWLRVLLGLAGVAAGTAALALSVRSWTERPAYLRGVPCVGAETRRCVRDVAAEVVDTEEASGRGWQQFYVRLRAADGRAEPALGHRIGLAQADPVFGALRPGSRVSVRVWDGDPARVDVPGVGRAETNESPLAVSVELTGFGLTALCAGGYGLWAARRIVDARNGWFDPRAGDRPLRHGRGFAVGDALVAASVAAGASLVVSDAFDVLDLRTLGALGASTALVTFLVRRHARA